jgi:DsbC/DsbD-like thiol-disulfide interchange protein
LQKVNTNIRLLVLTLFLAPVGWAQSPGQVVKATVTMGEQVTRPKPLVRASVQAEVLAGYHINDRHPSLDYLIPTEIKLEGSKQVADVNVIYPKGVPRKFAFSDAPLSVYEGAVQFEVAMELAPGTLPGSYEVKGQLGYQACNDHACLPPANVPLTFSFKVARRVPATRRAQ